MKVYITGVAGFIGSWTARTLLSSGHSVRGCDSLVAGRRDAVPSDVEFDPLDCSDRERLQTCIAGSECVIHCAALPHEGLSICSPHTIGHSVYSCSLAVFSAAIAANARRIVFLSSAARYGDQQPPFIETMASRPADPYGVAKFAAECSLRLLAEHHGVEYVLVAPFNVVGAGQAYDDPYRNVLSIFLRRVLSGKPPIVFGDGRQRRSFSCVRQCALQIARATTLPHANRELFNIGTHLTTWSIVELAELVAEVCDVDVGPQFAPTRAADVSIVSCSTEKAERLLGATRPIDLRATIAEMRDFIQTKGLVEPRYQLPIEIQSDRVPEVWAKQTV